MSSNIAVDLKRKAMDQFNRLTRTDSWSKDSIIHYIMEVAS